MSKNKLLIYIVTFLSLISLIYAETLSQETSSVSRIVGESPTEMLRLMGGEIQEKHPENLDVWIDYADTGVVVNKQPGDKLKLNIYSDNTATVTITYDADVFESDDCYANHIVFSGTNTCSLAVKPAIGDADTEINVDGTPIKISVITNPEILIITDSEKLYQEYNQEQNAVKAVLKQAYANAAKDKGVVYDLSWYKDEIGVDNPFDYFR